MSQFTKAYNTFLKYENEKKNRDEKLSAAKSSTGLLAPKNKKEKQDSGNNRMSELDKVAEYVNRIRQYRKA